MTRVRHRIVELFAALWSLAAMVGIIAAQEAPTPSDPQPDIATVRAHRELWTFNTGG